jgi:integrase
MEPSSTSETADPWGSADDDSDNPERARRHSASAPSAPSTNVQRRRDTLRWRDIELLDRRLTVRESFVRRRLETPKSRASRRTIELGPRTADVLRDHWRQTRYQGDDSLVFGHPLLGTSLDPSKISRGYMRSAPSRAGSTKPFRPWHDLRHTALTHAAAAGNPQAYVQLKVGHSQGTIAERYIHAAQMLFPGAAAKAEARMFGAQAESG